MCSPDDWAPSRTTTRTLTAAPRSVQNSFEQWNWCLGDHAPSIEDANSDRNVALAASFQIHGAIAPARWSRGSALIAVAAAAAGALPGWLATTQVPREIDMAS